MDELAKYSRILVAHYSPANGCCVDSGRALTVVPRLKVPLKQHVTHYFVDALDWSKRSKFGWVEDVEPFALDGFAELHLGGAKLDEATMLHVKTMLDAAARFPVGPPMGASYVTRGFEKKHMAFEVHRVILGMKVPDQSM